MPDGALEWFSWRGRRVAALVPSRLAGRRFALTTRTATRVERALVACTRFNEHMALASPRERRGIIVAEAVASSAIEDVVAPAGDVLAALEQGDHELTGPVHLVAANVAMLERALTDDDLSVPALLEWHRTLFAGEKSDGGAAGELRHQPGWIGGHSPLDAAVVLPPPEFVAELLDDLVSFVRDAEDDPLTVAAVAHAQFELIHPFADGNGRLGRALVSRALTERLGLVVPPPISRSILADRGGYVAGLTSYRFVRWDDWVGWFADVVRKSAEQ